MIKNMIKQSSANNIGKHITYTMTYNKNKLLKYCYLTNKYEKEKSCMCINKCRMEKYAIIKDENNNIFKNNTFSNEQEIDLLLYFIK